MSVIAASKIYDPEHPHKATKMVGSVASSKEAFLWNQYYVSILGANIVLDDPIHPKFCLDEFSFDST